MVRRYLYPGESEHLFFYLEQLGVRIHLNVSDQEKAIVATESFIKKMSGWRQPMMIDSIALATRELLKPKEINEEIIDKVIEFYPNVPGAAEKEEEDEDEKLTALLGSEAEDEEEVEDPECDDLYFQDKKKRAMEKAKVAEPTEEDMMELLKYCSEMGCSLKQCQDQNILNRMISFISNSDCFTRFSSDEYDRSVCIKIFMEKVDAYLLSCCTLNDFGTVNCAIQTLKKNIVPTKEQGIANPICHLKLEEKRECGDMELDESRERNYVEC